MNSEPAERATVEFTAVWPTFTHIGADARYHGLHPHDERLLGLTPQALCFRLLRRLDAFAGFAGLPTALKMDRTLLVRLTLAQNNHTRDRTGATEVMY